MKKLGLIIILITLFFNNKAVADGLIMGDSVIKSSVTVESIIYSDGTQTTTNGGYLGQNVYFFGLHGDDNNSGKNNAEAFRNAQTALDKAGLEANVYNGVSVYNNDSGAIIDYLEMPDYVTLQAPQSIILGGITMGFRSSVNVGNINPTDGFAVKVPTGVTGECLLNARAITVGSDYGIINEGSGEIIVNVDIINTSKADSIAVYNSSSGHIHINSSDIYLSTNSVGLRNDHPDGDIYANIQELEEKSDGIGVSTGVYVLDGDVYLSASKLQANIAYTAKSSATLIAQVGKIEGEEISEGSGVDVDVSIADTFFATKSTGVSTTSGITYVLKVTTEVYIPQSASYSIAWYNEIYTSQQLARVETRLQIDNTNTVYNTDWNPDSSGNGWGSNSGTVTVYLEEGTHDFDIDFRSTQNLKSVSIRRAEIEGWRLK